MNKADLKPGYLVEDREGHLKMVIPTTRGLTLIYQDMTTHGDLEYYKDDLTNKEYQKYDIMKVWGFDPFPYRVLGFITNDRELLWERKEKKKMTVAEIEKELGYEVEIISES